MFTYISQVMYMYMDYLKLCIWIISSYLYGLSQVMYMDYLKLCIWIISSYVYGLSHNHDFYSLP